MAENDGCIRRVVSITKYREASVDHHEWRFLQHDNRHSTLTAPAIFYCVFCLAFKHKEIEQDGAPTKYR